MIHVYRYAIVPLAMLLLPILALFNRKIGEGLRMRRKSLNIPEFPERPIWIHASSGEFEYAKSVIRELKSLNPYIPIVVTYFSPTYAKNVAQFPGVDFSAPLPLDLPGPVSQFLKRANPRILLLARTDFWPELLTQTRRRQIPIQVFAYTQKPPQQMNPLARVMTRWRLKLVDRIHCVSEEDRLNILILRISTPIDVAGDTRYDQVKFRLDHPKTLPPVLKPPEGIPCLVAGSTWAEDEAILIPAISALLKNNRLKLILVPHEPTENHIAELKKQLEVLNLGYVLYSESRAWEDVPVLLVDQVGCLAELYAWGDVAFIGGSFKRTVHSVMEALGAQLKTFVGPLHLNSREAVEFQTVACSGLRAVTAVRDVDELRREIEALGDLTEFRRALHQEFARRLGATTKLVGSLNI